MPRRPLSRVARARVQLFQEHHRREGAAVVAGAISIGARTSRASSFSTSLLASSRPTPSTLP
eukprot:1652885-Pyramimonas_sp.AAC.1